MEKRQQSFGQSQFSVYKNLTCLELMRLFLEHPWLDRFYGEMRIWEQQGAIPPSSWDLAGQKVKDYNPPWVFKHHVLFHVFCVSSSPPLPFLLSILPYTYSSGPEGTKEEGSEAAKCEPHGILLDKTGIFVDCHDALLKIRVCIYEGTSSIENRLLLIKCYILLHTLACLYIVCIFFILLLAHWS